MELSQFHEEMRRIEAMFGEKHYGNERKEMIWRRVRGLSQDRFRAVCDDLIGTCRAFPVVKDFDDASSRVREQDCSREKYETSSVIKKFFSQDYHAELLQLTRDRLDGKIPDDEFKEQMRIVDRAVELANGADRPNCFCNDGAVDVIERRTGNRFVFRCTTCALGNNYPAYPKFELSMTKHYEVMG